MVDVVLELEGQTVGSLHADGRTLALSYSDDWVVHGYALGPDVPLVRGRQYRQSFGFVEDASPDRWGRTLIAREARARAKREQRAPRTLGPIDYFLGVSDAGRMGALRAIVDGQYVADHLQVPPLVDLGKLLHASSAYQAGRYDDDVMALLMAPGSSLGGARPKATVCDATGVLYMAKFPRNDDEYSVERWEFIALELARAAGIRCAEARLEKVDSKLVLLSKRFDRRGERRVHVASAMNLLELKDGDRSSYAEIADLIQREGEAAADSSELFRRMIFNIAVNNVDDHLRNHAFLRGKRGWTLSPAYDLNPMSRIEKAPRLTTAIIDDAYDADLSVALDSAEFFGLSRAAAEGVIERVKEAVSGWRQTADAAGAPRREITDLQDAFLE